MDFGKCDNSNSGTHFGKHKRLIVNILQLYSPSYLAANKKEINTINRKKTQRTN